MGEIIQIHIGQAGIQTGTEVWDLLHKEYCIEKNGKLKGEQENCKIEKQTISHALFQECPSEKYYPRSIFLDTEPACIEEVKKGDYKQSFNPSNFINGKESGAYYSRSYYTFGKELIDICFDKIRKEIEKCSSFQGFILNHSICGGTGSGLNSLLIEQLNVSYGKKGKITLSQLPSIHQQEVTESYNATLSISSLIEHSDLNNCIDNTALYKILSHEDQYDYITYKDINRLIAQMQSSILVNYQLNGMMQFQQNIVPYPRLHFVRGTAQPIQYNFNKLDKLIKNCYSNDYQYLTVYGRGNLLTQAVIGRGDIAPIDLIKLVKDQQYSFDSIAWIPDNVKIYHSDKKSLLIQDNSIQQLNKSVSIIQNNTSIKDNFNIIGKRFDMLYSKRAFVHWYVGDSDDFSQAREDLANIEKDYEEISIADMDEFEENV